MNKVVIKALQGSVVTQTVLGGLTTYSPVANNLLCIYAKYYENRLRADKDNCNENRVQFFGPPCIWTYQSSSLLLPRVSEPHSCVPG